MDPVANGRKMEVLGMALPRHLMSIVHGKCLSGSSDADSVAELDKAIQRDPYRQPRQLLGGSSCSRPSEADPYGLDIATVHGEAAQPHDSAEDKGNVVRHISSGISILRVPDI